MNNSSPQHHSKFYSEILNRLASVRKKQHLLEFFYGSLATLLVLLVVGVTGTVLEQLLTFEVTGRTIIASIIAVSVLGAFGFFAARPLLRLLGIIKSEESKATAIKVGKHFPEVHDRLIDAIEIYENRENVKQHYSLDLVDASFNDLYELIKPIDFREAVNNSRLKKIRKIVAYAFTAFVLIFVISPGSFLSSLNRLSHYSQSFAEPQPLQFIIEPGNLEVVRGENIPITIRTAGKPVKNLTLLTRIEGQKEFDKLTLSRNSDGTFHSEIKSIKSSTEYSAASEEYQSDIYTINVLDRPLIRTFQLTMRPPAYTRIPIKVMDENVGDVSAYPGTTINISLYSSKEIASAQMLFNDSDSVPLTIEGLKAETQITLKKNRTYHFVLTDKKGLQNADPIEYTIRVIPDEFPTVEITRPGENIDLTEAMQINLLAQVKDDFGFSKIQLAYRLAHSKFEKPAEEFSVIDLPFPHIALNALDVPYRWDLSSLNLVPEDVIAYYIEVFDNDNINGPKSGRSETYLARFPSLEEVFSDVEETHQQSVENMQSVAKEAQELAKDVDQLQREMKKNNKNDWQTQQKVNEMSKRYEAMKQKLQETSEKMNEMVQKMDENKLLSDKTLDKYQELQKLLDQLKSPELQEAMKKLQEQMNKEQLTPEQMKKATEQLKANEEAFRKNLERMIDLLKRIAIEQKLDELVKRTNDLLKQQKDLQQQSSKTSSSDKQKQDELAQKQDDLKKQMDALQKESKELEKKMEEFAKEMPLSEMQKTNEMMDKKNVQSKMSKSSQQMQAGDMKSAEQSQSQAEEDLKDLQEQMKNTQNSLASKQQQQIANAMKKQLENILELSKREEGLKDQTQGLDPNSQRFREGAQEQSDLRTDLNNVANAMSELGKKTFAVSPEMGKEIGDAMQSMDNALQQMENRNPGGAGQQQSGAMGSLNRAAMQMQNALNGMMQGGQGGMGMAGLMGRMGSMAGGQGGINQGTKDAMGMGGEGQGMGAEQAAEYQRLGGQQAALRKSLEQLSEEAKNSSEYSKLLGDLDRVAQDMREVETDLQQGNVNPETMKKQERILSRLLDSQRSTRERDYEKRRRAEAGKNYKATSPGDIDLTTQEGRNKLREEMLKVMDGKYSKDYEDLIKRYFEQLEKEGVKQ